jgi:hypothetical protein
MSMVWVLIGQLKNRIALISCFPLITLRACSHPGKAKAGLHLVAEQCLPGGSGHREAVMVAQCLWMRGMLVVARPHLCGGTMRVGRRW